MAREEEEEPASPLAQILQTKELDMCIIAAVGFKTMIDPILYKKSVEQSLLKHPRFSSILVEKKGKCWWKRTQIDIDDHIIVPHLDPDVELGDEFVEDFVSNLSKIPLDMTKPPWEMHILNVKTSDANAVMIFKVHHSIGDGVSLLSAVHACSRKITDPKSLPIMPLSKKNTQNNNSGFFVLIWTIFSVIFYTLVDIAVIIATIMFLKDEESPIRATVGSVLNCKRFVHRIVHLDDVKLVKTAMNASINDVVVGVIEAGLSRYLNTRYERDSGKIIKNANFLPSDLRLRSSIWFNLRPTPTIEDMYEMMEKEELSEMWGNAISFAILPFTISLEDDPLTHIHRAKSNMKCKKLSLGHKISFYIMKLGMLLFGTKSGARVLRALLKNTTFTISNVMGPQEEVLLFGHHLAYISPSLFNYPQSLVIHCQSYAGKIIISIGADEKLIPNPHQLCDDLVKSLEDIKEAVIKKGLLNSVEHV